MACSKGVGVPNFSIPHSIITLNKKLNVNVTVKYQNHIYILKNVSIFIIIHMIVYYVFGLPLLQYLFYSDNKTVLTKHNQKFCKFFQ